MACLAAIENAAVGVQRRIHFRQATKKSTTTTCMPLVMTQHEAEPTLKKADADIMPTC